MADIREDILLNIKLEDADNEQQVDALTKKITTLKTETEKLNATNKELAKSGQQNTKEYLDNAKQIEINKQKITENTASRKALISTLVAEDNSIKALKVRNSELLKQRDLLSTSTDEGRKAIMNINREMDENSKTITKNSTAVEKQRFNIGNYSSALDNLIPGLGGMANGIQAGTKASLAFIATGIGAVIAVLGLALYALISYFKGSEEGQNRLNKIMVIGGVIMEKITDQIEALGKKLFEAKGAFDFLLDVLEKSVPFFGLALAAVKVYTKDVVDEIEKRAEQIASLERQANEQERELIVERARIFKEATQLRLEADELEGASRLKKITQAIALERSLLEQELLFAQTKLEQAKINAEDDPTIENKKLQAEALSELLNKEAEFNTGIRKLNKERIKIEQELLDALREMRIAELDRHYEGERNEYLKHLEFIKTFHLDVEADQKGSLGKMLKVYEANKKKEVDADKKAAKDQERIDRMKNEMLIGGVEMVTKEKSAARVALTAIFKKDAIQEMTVNTYNAALAAYKSLAGIPIVGPVLGAIAAAAVGVFGLAQIAKVAGIQFEPFARGGRADKRGTFSGPSDENGGRGVDYIREDGKHRIRVGGGENFYVLNRSASQEVNQLSALNEAHGGASWHTGTRRGTMASGGFVQIPGVGSSIATQDAVRQSNIQQERVVTKFVPVLIYQDFEAKAASINEPISRAKVI